MAEWSIAPVLKTGKGQPFVSSNLTASAKNKKKALVYKGIFSFIHYLACHLVCHLVRIARIFSLGRSAAQMCRDQRIHGFLP